MINSIISSVRADDANVSLLLDWSDGRTDQFHYIWLKDNDPALREKNGQINHDPFDIHIDIKPRTFDYTGEMLVIEWEGGYGSSRYDAAWLAKHSYQTNIVSASRPRRLGWTTEEMSKQFQKHNYQSVANTDDGLRNLLQCVWDHGFAILENVPERDGMVIEVSRLFGYPRETNYGTMFELMGSPTAEDRGHDNAFLPSHVDNPYRNPIPTVQLLHCMRNSVAGGESTIVDGIRVAEEVQLRDKQAFELLSSIPVTYRYHDDDVDLSSEGPIIRINQRNEIIGILASPINVQPFDCAPDIMLPFYKAYHLIGSLIRSPVFRFQTKLNSGDLMIMDNTRVLHGRTAFHSDGARRLQGCYADIDGMWSKLAVLKEF